MDELGVRSISILIKAFFMKKVWQMYSHPISLLSRVFNPIKPLALTTGFFVRKMGYTRSWGFHGLQRAEQLSLKGAAEAW